MTTVAGSVVVNVAVTDTLGFTDAFDFKLVVAQKLRIVTRSATAKVGRAFRFRLRVAGGVAPRRWKILRGSLPAGLHINTRTGRLFGTARRTTTSKILLQVTDRLGAVSRAKTSAANETLTQSSADHESTFDPHGGYDERRSAVCIVRRGLDRGLPAARGGAVR